MTEVITPSILRHIRKLAECDVPVRLICAELNWDEPKLRRICQQRQIKLPVPPSANSKTDASPLQGEMPNGPRYAQGGTET